MKEKYLRMKVRFSEQPGISWSSS